MINSSPITWHWRHVRGHQDNHFGPLDRWASLNVKCDNAAKARCNYNILHPPGVQDEIAGEMWRLYLVHNDGTKQKICTALCDELHKAIEGKHTIQYMEDNFFIPSGAFEEISWNAIKLAQEKSNFFQNRWASRWAAEVISTGTVMQDRELWDVADCPR
eukprot:15336111-Ditylum_brightwellii.AAC.1